MKKTVAIMAPTGMLGSMVYNVFKDSYRLVLVYRDPKKIRKLNAIYGGVSEHRRVAFDLQTIQEDYLSGFADIGSQTKKLVSAIGRVDAVINCAGITKPYSLKDPTKTVFINGALPHILSSVYGNKLIQIATDCVYNGLTGAPYDETAPKTPNDLYGLSKLLGEPTNSLILRTSIIGPEIDGHLMLLDWFKKQEDKTVSGFTNHLWNGVTTREFARICNVIICNRKQYPKTGVFHIFSTSLSKYDMLVAFKKKYKIDVNVKRCKAPIAVDRRLTTRHNLCHTLNIPSFTQLLTDL